MACSDGDVGRGRANRVNIGCSNAIYVIYQVRIGLSLRLGLHDDVDIWGPGNMCF